MAPTANAGKDRTIEGRRSRCPSSNIDDAWLSRACGFDVSASSSGTFDAQARARHRPESRRARDVEVRRLHHLDRGRVGQDVLRQDREHVEDRVPRGRRRLRASRARHRHGQPRGGSFPVGGGPPGHGKFEYEAGFLVGGPDELPFVFAVSEGTWDSKSFDRATEKICAKLS